MEWLKKKKQEAKQAAAKISNKRTAFQGEGNMLGGTSEASSVPPAAMVSRGPSIKLPFSSNKPPPLSIDEQKRRELQAKALEERSNVWNKRVATARKARLQQEGEQESKFQYTEPIAADSSTVSPPVVFSNEEVKARELQSAQMQMGFNPYAATFSSSTQAVSVMNAIGSESGAPSSGSDDAMHPINLHDDNVRHVAGSGTALESLDAGENNAVYVLCRQEPSRAMTAAETLIKMLSNILQNSQEEKFRKIRLENATIRSKLVAVPGAIDVLAEAGFVSANLDGEAYLMLTAFQAERVQSAIDRLEVAVVQLRHDVA